MKAGTRVRVWAGIRLSITLYLLFSLLWMPYAYRSPYWWGITLLWMIVTKLDWVRLYAVYIGTYKIGNYIRAGSQYYGWRRQGFADTSKYLLLPSVSLAGCVILVAYIAGTLDWPELFMVWYSIPEYWVWAAFQMTILLCYMYELLVIMCAGQSRIAVVLCGLVFGLIHLPNRLLTVVCFLGGIALAGAFQKWKNIPAVALGQAIIAVTIVMSVPEALTHEMKVGRYYYEPSRAYTEADALVVLGYGFLHDDPKALNFYTQEIEACVKRNKNLKVIIITGWRAPGREVSEAFLVNQSLQQRGIAVPIVLEEQASTTHANIALTASLLNPYSPKRVLIIGDEVKGLKVRLLARYYLPNQTTRFLGVDFSPDHLNTPF